MHTRHVIRRTVSTYRCCCDFVDRVQYTHNTQTVHKTPREIRYAPWLIYWTATINSLPQRHSCWRVPFSFIMVHATHLVSLWVHWFPIILIILLSEWRKEGGEAVQVHIALPNLHENKWTCRLNLSLMGGGCPFVELNNLADKVNWMRATWMGSATGITDWCN